MKPYLDVLTVIFGLGAVACMFVSALFKKRERFSKIMFSLIPPLATIYSGLFYLYLNIDLFKDGYVNCIGLILILMMVVYGLVSIALWIPPLWWNEKDKV